MTTTKRVDYTKVAVVWSSDAIVNLSLRPGRLHRPGRWSSDTVVSLSVYTFPIARKPVTSTQFGCSKNNLIKVFCPVRVNRWDGDEVDGDCEFGHYAAGRAG